MRLRLLPCACSGLALSLFLACSGSSDSTPAAPVATPPAAAVGLAYANPAAGGWTLVKDASSTATRLVLNLVGPPGLLTRGVGFNIQAPAGLKFDTFADGLPIHDTKVFNLQSAAPGQADPVALAGGLLPGNILTVGIFQKGQDQPAVDAGAALCQIALKLDTTAGITAGQKLTLTVPKARIIPQDLGKPTDSMFVLSRKLKLQDITVNLGVPTAN